MTLSQAGLNFIKQWEGFRDRPYNDGYGGLTIGYGHLIKRGESFGQITEEQGEQILAADAGGAVNTVNNFVTVPLSQSQFDALVSLVFNWGSGNFQKSLLLDRLNSGDYAGAAERLGEHPVTSGGRFSQGLQNRRTAEKELFLSGSESGPTAQEDAGVIPDDTIEVYTYEPSSSDQPIGIGTGLILGGAAAIGLLILILSRD